MNKTVTINISGIIFHIEEDAYERLSKYLNTIKSYFKDSDGRDEIMADIEARIAELLREKVSNVKQVVMMNDVDHVISVMGKPEDYTGEASDEGDTGRENTSSATNEDDFIDFSKKKRRRVFRDPDDKVIGGVCSGIASYFDFDPLWLRLGLVGFTLLGGAGILIYIILWIVIPIAKTTAEKLEMRGEKVNINNIKKTVEEEMGNLKQKAKDFEKEVKNFSSPENRAKVRTGTERFADFMTSLFGGIFKVLGKIIAVVMIFIGVIFTIGLFSTVFGVAHIGWDNSFEWMNLVLPNEGQFVLTMITLILFLGIPFIMLIYAGIRVLLGIRERNKYVNIGATSLWAIGVGLMIWVVINFVVEFRENSYITEVYKIDTKSDTLYLKAEDSGEGWNQDAPPFRKKRRSFNNRDIDFVKIDEKVVRFGFPDLSVETSEDDTFRIEIVRYAHGTDKKSASNRAKNIRYKDPSVVDSMVIFDEVCYFPTSDKWRGQDVKIIVKVPKGKAVFLGKSIKNVIYDVENIHDVWDGDMLNRTWIMKEEGLDCLDCKGLDLENGEIHIRDGEKEIHIKTPGIPPPPPPAPEKHS